MIQQSQVLILTLLQHQPAVRVLWSVVQTYSGGMGTYQDLALEDFLAYLRYSRVSFKYIAPVLHKRGLGKAL